MVWPSHELELTQLTLLTGATLGKVNRGEDAWGLLATDPGKGPDPPPLGDNLSNGRVLACLAIPYGVRRCAWYM